MQFRLWQNGRGGDSCGNVVIKTVAWLGVVIVGACGVVLIYRGYTEYRIEYSVCTKGCVVAWRGHMGTARRSHKRLVHRGVLHGGALYRGKRCYVEVDLQWECSRHFMRLPHQILFLFCMFALAVYVSAEKDFDHSMWTFEDRCFEFENWTAWQYHQVTQLFLSFFFSEHLNLIT